MRSTLKQTDMVSLLVPMACIMFTHLSIFWQVCLFNLLQVTNGAWQQFLRTVCGFLAEELNELLMASYVLLYIGTLVYKYFMLKWSWRSVFIISILLNRVLLLMQLFLIDDMTLGLTQSICVCFG
jgi:hypothetical protein